MSDAAARRNSSAARNGNRLLASLDAATLGRLQPLLQLVNLEQKSPIWEPNQPIEAVYFPIDCVVSVLAVTSDGPTVEIGTVGNEGVAGLPIFFGAESSAGRSIVQVAGSAHRMDSATFRQESGRDGALRQLLHSYALAFITQISQSVACNQAHNVVQRLARWLLMVQDRVGRDEFALTHEFMAQMLAVRRATVTEAAGALQAQELIRYRRGIVAVLDREGLERAACECYALVRDEFNRRLGAPDRLTSS